MPPKRRGENQVREAYEALIDARKQHGFIQHVIGDRLLSLFEASAAYIVHNAIELPLVSKVPGKEYISYRSKRETSSTRPTTPLNIAMLEADVAAVVARWKAWEVGRPTEGLPKLVYTMMGSVRAALELINPGNRAGPAKYFEALVGHLFARELGVEPRQDIVVPMEGETVPLTMDFLFELDDGRPNLHLGVKLSTRERGAEVWAHQRILDHFFKGTPYRGFLICFSEMNATKVKVGGVSRPGVKETTVGMQWLVYQRSIARLDRIYYFDPPPKYEAMARKYPESFVLKPFADFFTEREEVLALRRP